MAALQQAQLESALARTLALAHALTELHAAQKIHGSLCPEALTFGPDGSVQLQTPAPLEQAVSRKRLRYASPEQAGPTPLVDARSDLYSLGLILYEWLLGPAAFDALDPLELGCPQVCVTPQPPHCVDPGVPWQVSQLVMRLLAKSPGARYASAGCLADDLQRCLQDLRASGQVTRLALGGSDVRAQFVIPEQLYGRAGEMTALVRLWRQAASGDVRHCLVRGSAGMGKTALVRAMRDTVVASGGMLVEGRFGAQQRARPYPAVLDACQTLLRQVLAGTQAERARWRTRLQAALGANLAVLQELLPEVEWITGRQPPAPQRTGLAAQQHMQRALMDLLALFAGPDHPLLLFLDDLQWADAPSLAFMRAVLRERSCSHLLLVGAYRDSAISIAHPLAQLVHALNQDHAGPSDIRLAPLSADEVAALIDDACSHISTLPALSSLVVQEAQGNPQGTRQYLHDLVAQERLRYDPASKGWCWSPAEESARP
jgi:AAA ATPase domain